MFDVKHLSCLNKKYWKTVPADKTTSADILPSIEILEKIPVQDHRVLDVGCVVTANSPKNS